MCFRGAAGRKDETAVGGSGSEVLDSSLDSGMGTDDVGTLGKLVYNWVMNLWGVECCVGYCRLSVVELFAVYSLVFLFQVGLVVIAVLFRTLALKLGMGRLRMRVSVLCCVVVGML